MIRRSLFLKLFLGNLVVMLGIIGMGFAISYHLLNRSYQRDAARTQDSLTQLAALHVQDVWPLDQAGADRLCKTLFANPDARLTIIDPAGRVLGDSLHNPAEMVNHLTAGRPEVLDAMKGLTGTDTRASETDTTLYRYVAMPVRREDKVVAAARVAVPVRTIVEGESFLRQTLMWSALAAVLMTAVLGLLTSYLWYSPLRRISFAARQIAAGDLSHRARVRGADELGELATALNEMRESLAQKIGLIAAQHQDSQVVLSNLHDGVIALDRDGKIVIINGPAAAIFGADAKAIGAHLQTLVRAPEVARAFSQALGNSKPVSVVFGLDSSARRRSIELHAVGVPESPSTIACIMVLRDVTELAEAAAMKTAFVANASHELRTPVATLRAAVDSLAGLDPVSDAEEYAKLASMLDRHVGRLESMINDLLDLHMVESSKMPLRIQEIPLADLAQWAGNQFAAPSAAKNVTLEIAAPYEPFSIRSDRKLLELILRNLLDNAIKFTSERGRVICAFTPQPDGLTVRVTDNGCGIRPQDLPRIFERFYQGDASRSGEPKVRGTGLGLAIVKHASERLGGKVSVQSEWGRGTTMTLTLPLDSAAKDGQPRREGVIGAP